MAAALHRAKVDYGGIKNAHDATMISYCACKPQGSSIMGSYNCLKFKSGHVTFCKIINISNISAIKEIMLPREKPTATCKAVKGKKLPDPSQGLVQFPVL